MKTKPESSEKQALTAELKPSQPVGPYGYPTGNHKPYRFYREVSSSSSKPLPAQFATPTESAIKWMESKMEWHYHRARLCDQVDDLAGYKLHRQIAFHYRFVAESALES